jgi:uncharacterized pyridoxal phosphate-containing UPF0001 family protein
MLRDEARRLGIVGPEFTNLSMGMSHDFEVAIEEGATLRQELEPPSSGLAP